MCNKEYIPKAANGHKRMTTKGYYIYYMPDHHLANSSGTVYEHMLVAEEVLGRPLNKGEFVHHKDRDKTNNSPDNIMVFKTNSDHTAFHNGAKIEKVGDVYIAHKRSTTTEDGKRISIDKCPMCGKEKSCNTELCRECYKKEQAKDIPPKEELYELLPNHSMCEIGRIYDVSDNAVRKWCRKYGLPFKREDIDKEFGIVKKKKEKKELTSPKPVNMYTLDGVFIMRFESLGQAALYLIDNDMARGGKDGIAGHISCACRGKQKQAYGFIWKFIS